METHCSGQLTEEYCQCSYPDNTISSAVTGTDCALETTFSAEGDLEPHYNNKVYPVLFLVYVGLSVSWYSLGCASQVSN